MKGPQCVSLPELWSVRCSLASCWKNVVPVLYGCRDVRSPRRCPIQGMVDRCGKIIWGETSGRVANWSGGMYLSTMRAS